MNKLQVVIIQVMSDAAVISSTCMILGLKEWTRISCVYIPLTNKPQGFGAVGFEAPKVPSLLGKVASKPYWNKKQDLMFTWTNNT